MAVKKPMAKSETQAPVNKFFKTNELNKWHWGKHTAASCRKW